MAILGPMLGLPSILEGLMPAELFLPGTHIVDATTLLPPSLTWTAGSIVSRPDDLAVFQRALQTGQLLDAGLLAQMHDWRSCDLLGGKVDYGLGTMRYTTAAGDVIGHGGLNFGFHVETFYAPDVDLAFCHMHNYLPAQTAAVTEQALGIALGSETMAWEACQVPEDLGVDDTGDRVRMRFKGPIAAPGGTGRVGMADFRLRLGAEESRLNGIDRLGVFAGAQLVNNGGKTFVQAIAYGPPGATEGVTMRTMMAYVDPALPAKADDAGLVKAGVGTVTPLLIDLYLKAGTLAPTKTCIVAVPDMARTGEAFFCDGKATSMQAGSMLRFAADIPLTADPTAVAGFLSMLKVPACSCADANGTMGACPTP